jgi:hypothetical protein
MGTLIAVVSVLVAGVGSLAGYLLQRQANRRLAQEHEDERARLRLDAAMRAGSLLAPGPAGPADPAVVASGLLALTRLDHAELAVALLVDLWSKDSARVSPETAILVVDAALRSDRPSAQLVAAELLCRHAAELDPCQSLHWPSSIDGCWLPTLAARAKLLLTDGLIIMTYSCSSRPTENALRSIAVRLYGIYDADPDPRVRGCVATLIKALVPALERLDYTDFMQGTRSVVTLADLRTAASAAAPNPDGFLARLVADRSSKLAEWAGTCHGVQTDAGCLGNGVFQLASPSGG